MKCLFLALLLFSFLDSFSQDSITLAAACPSPKACGRNLNNQIPALTGINAIKIKDYCYAKNNDCDYPNDVLSENFRDVSYEGYDKCNPHLLDDCLKDPKNLRYRVFYPSDDIFTYSNTCKLPVLIYFHGGGFVDCNGSYLTGDLQTFCTEFAKRGFITISVEYRLGVKLPPKTQRDNKYTAHKCWVSGELHRMPAVLSAASFSAR